jgi:hypothetical protein
LESSADTAKIVKAVLSTRDYFDVVLPTILRWKGAAATALGVNVLFAVTGKGGGTWTVRLRPPVAAVVGGDEWKWDLKVQITVNEMANILAGTFDARQALAEGNVELSGDLSVLKRVGFLFQAGGSPVQVQNGR